jgi:hypothetical protein
MQASVATRYCRFILPVSVHPYKEREFISPARTKFITVFYWKFLYPTVDTLAEDCETPELSTGPGDQFYIIKQLAL